MTLRYKILLGLFILALMEGAFLVIINKRASFLEEGVITAIEKSKSLIKKDVAPLPVLEDRDVDAYVSEDKNLPKSEDKIIEKNLEVKERIMSFTPQAPFGEWSDPMQQDGCEEAVSLMAVSWAKGEEFNLEKAKEKIISASEYELKNFGEFRDSSASDVLVRIIKGYYGYDNAFLKNNISVDDIIAELNQGNVVITPMNGQLLKNPFYTPPGPIRHMIIIRGYDEKTKEFITFDPGTKHGENYRYNVTLFYNAIRDYLTGYHETITKEEKNMIVISPSDI